MANSNQTYDAFVCHTAADHLIGERFGGMLRDAGLRPWLPRWSAIPGAPLLDELRFAASASRLSVRLIGRTGLDSWIDSTVSPSITVLTPRCPLAPSDLPVELAGDPVIDWRTDPFPDIRQIVHSLAPSARHRRLDRESLKRDTIRSYDWIAEKFTDQWFDHPPLVALEKMMALLPPHSSILDAGCGPGHHARFLARRGHEVTGIDLSGGMLDMARKSVRAVTFARMDAQDLRFSPQSFDGVWCAGMASHIPREEIVNLFLGFRRVLKRSGVLGINLQVARQSEIVNLEKDCRFFEYYRDQSEIVRLLRKAGFDEIGNDYGETTRNTHELDLTLKWVTVYATPGELPREESGMKEGLA
jgi:SAM-dependent methyltransferase